ncbi:MAG: hypothetical protein P4L75_01635 [Clostridia bacterium]|nr:hypothetical protein [Clostridia bacterium]
MHHFFSKNALRALAIKTYDGSGQAMHPKVLYFKNGWNGWNYWMSYTPYPNTNDKYENPSLAVSQDGVTWTIPKGLRNPVIGSPADVRSGGHNSDPDLVMCGRTMELWYRYNPARRHGGQADSSINRIYMMASVNGTRWTAPRLVLSGGYMYYSPAVLYDSGWKVWFSNDDGKLYFTESADLTTWTNPVAVSLGITGFDIWHQDIIRTCQGYKIIFSAYRKGQFDLDNQRLYYAFSRDGLRFSAPYMILAPSSGADRLDNRMIYRSSILDVNGSSSIYYSAMSRKGEWHIFLTHLNMPKITPVYGS